MNRRALLLALVLAMTGAAVLLLYMRRFEQEMSGGDHVELLMAIKPIERGSTITEDMLTTRSVPFAYVEDRAVKVAEKSKVLGIKTSTPLQAQQTLLWTDLAITTEERDLSSLVQPGKRGVTVRATGGDDTRGNALIRPGDYVDVIVTMVDETEQAPAAAAAGKDKSAIVLLQRVLVLAVGLDTRFSQAPSDPKLQGMARSSEKLLTLSLNLQEAQLLALAVDRGRISVAVRNPDDQRVVDQVPDMKSNALLDSQARDVQRLRPAPKRDEIVKIESEAPRMAARR